MTTYNKDIPTLASDQSRQFAKPHRLYGREAAVASLKESFDRICRGQGEIVLVPGYSGVGKTALVQELRKPVRERNGFFLQGKFNQYQQNIPYFALRQALAELARELQSEEEPLRQQWKLTLRKAVGVLGRQLVDLVPEFDSILGPHPPVAEISPLEARHRFAGVLRNFFEVVCRPEHPVVLFIDDWQCADTASFELLKQLQIGTTLRYLLVIAPYRDNEVDRAHPLIATLEELRRQAVPVKVIEVRNLGVKDVRTWVKELLLPAAENPEALARLIQSRTKGNPFFTQASFAFLHEFGLLQFDRSSDSWRWKMETTDAGLPGDVVELFRLRLLRLDQGSRDLLARAACLGNRFDTDSLAVISRRNPDECRALLLTLQEMVAPVGDEAPQWFMFVHDRVQQAAYGLIPPEELPSSRLEIARLLLARLGPEQLAEQLFEVVGHLNIGQLLIVDSAEQIRAVELNVAAARKARAATAYRAALQFHRAAGRFLAVLAFAGQLWSSRHELARSLFLEWAESEFLEGERAEAERHIEQAVAHAGTPIEKAEALNILIVQNTLQARYPEAIAAGRQALNALGIILPEEGYEAACDTEIDLVRRNLMGRSIASLVELPVMSDPEMRMAVKILITMGPPCYRSHQRLWGVIVPKVVNLTLKHGNIEQVGYSHPAFAGLLCWVADDFDFALEFGELATRLMTDVFHSPTDRSVYALMIGSSVRHWFHHLRKGSEEYAEACEIGLQSGNLQYTAYALGHNMYCRFYQGIALGDLSRESERSLAFSRTRLNQWAIDLLEGGLRIFSSLSGSEADAVGREPLLEADYLGEVEAHRNIQVTCIYKILKTFSLLVLGRYDEALEMSDQAEPILYTVGMQGLLPWPEHVFTRLLILTALVPDTDNNRQAGRRAELVRGLAKLRLWADHSPENFEHKYQLAAAELARLDLRPTEAMGLYEQAIDGAKSGGFVQWEGVANERAARFWQERGNDRLAQMYWQQAYGCFARWGAHDKLRVMESEYRQWLAADLPQPTGTTDVLAELTRNVLLERQVQLLRNQPLQEAEVRMRSNVEKQTGELARATEYLRAEVAERKRIEAELHLHREQLEERVMERTVALEKSLAERRQAEEALHRLNRELRAISSCNQVLVRAENERTLLDEICRIVCDEAYYRMAWVGYAGNDTAKNVWPVALAGVEEDYLALAGLTWADTERGGGPAGTAIRSGRTDCSRDIATDPRMALWRENALHRGYRSIVALPLKDENANVFGVFLIYSSEPNAFTPDEIRLLEELAGDLAFGIQAMHNRNARKQAEEELHLQTLGLEQEVAERQMVQEELETLNEQLEQRVGERTAELERANVRLLELDRMKSMFIASMSHELRTPLNSVIGFSRILHNEWLGPLNGEQKENLAIVLRSGKLLLSLINDIIDVSKIEADMIEAVTEDFDVYDVVSEAMTTFENDFRDKGIRLTVLGFHHIMQTDRTRLLQCLLNLVSNAVKFTEKGTITVSTALPDGGDMLELSVADTGIGIREEDLDNLFSPFVRLDSPLKSTVPGTGLGLYLARKLVREVLQGDITATSAPGVGSRFVLTVPINGLRRS